MTETTQSNQILELEGLMQLCDKAASNNKRKVLDLFDKIDKIHQDVKTAKRMRSTLRDLRSTLRQNQPLSDDDKKKLDDVKTFLSKNV